MQHNNDIFAPEINNKVQAPLHRAHIIFLVYNLRVPQSSSFRMKIDGGTRIAILLTFCHY